MLWEFALGGRPRRSSPVCRMGTFVGYLLHATWDGDCWDVEKKDTAPGQSHSV